MFALILFFYPAPAFASLGLSKTLHNAHHHHPQPHPSYPRSITVRMSTLRSTFPRVSHGSFLLTEASLTSQSNVPTPLTRQTHICRYQEPFYCTALLYNSIIPFSALPFCVPMFVHIFQNFPVMSASGLPAPRSHTGWSRSYFPLLRWKAFQPVITL